MWFSHRYEGPSATYNVPLAVHVRGDLDVQVLRDAFTDVVTRHGALRTSFTEVDGVAHQRVHPANGTVYLPTVQVASTHEAFALLESLAKEPFDLTVPPVRLQLHQVSDDEHVLALILHHLVCDGWSMPVLLRDLELAYAARAGDEVPAFAEPGPSYVDYTHWHHELLGDATDPASLGARQTAYWCEQLRDLPDELSLPHDRPRKQSADLAGRSVVVGLPQDVVAKARALAHTLGATEFMVLEGAVAATLSKFGAGHDIPLGTATSGRIDEALHQLVGLYTNTQVVRVDLEGDPTFRDVVARVRETSLSALSLQDVPFERIVEAVNPPRANGRNPLFQVHVELHAEELVLSLPGLEATVTMPPMPVAKFDLSFAFVHNPHDKVLELHLEYSPDLFAEPTAERLAHGLVRLLSEVVASPDTRLSAVEVLTDADRELLDTWSRGPVTTLEQTVLGSFEDRVRATPEAVALVAGETRLTFEQLNAWVNRCAHGLIAVGIGPDDVVAMALPRSAAAVVTWLAIGKSGGVYAPVDPHLPAARIRALLESARPRALVTTTDLLGDLDEIEVPVVVTDTEQVDRPESDPGQDDRVAPLLLDHAAYIIFTSGSTGKPKAVTVLHRALANLWDFHTKVTFPSPSSAQEQRRVALSANLAFDTSWEGVLAMIAGHELHLLDEPTRRDPRAAAAYVAAQRIDQLDVTPSFGQQLLSEGLLEGDHVPSTLMFGGEAVSEVLWTQARSAGRTKVFNYYGPSEFCIEASGCALDEHETSTVGRPVSNTQVLVLDEHLHPVPPGVVGELYLAGANLGRGYLGQAGRTAERFVANPYGPAGSRMYRSGDLAKWTSAGFLVFRGRSDDQVKLRGFRIELEEIQRVIESHEKVAEAAVVLREDEPGDKRIVAYVVPRPGGSAVGELRGHLESRLPDYMVPAAFVELAALPLNRNAKLDRKALPVPAYESRVSEGRAPGTDRERAVAVLFAGVLKVDEVGLDDNFFELGGHSLLATRLINQVRTELAVDLNLMAFFAEPTVAGIVAGITDPADAPARPRLVRRD
jgi:nonribosomal peptide synthetase DhbF